MFELFYYMFVHVLGAHLLTASSGALQRNALDVFVLGRL